MFQRLLKNQETINRYSQKPFAPAINSYLAWMEEKGYAKNTMLKRLFLLASFSDYLAGQRVNTIENISAWASCFVSNWVQESKRKNQTQNPERLTRELNSGLNRFIHFFDTSLEVEDCPASVRGLEPWFREILTDFIIFCRKERGLAEPTISLYSLYAGRFLTYCQTIGGLLPSQWNHQTIQDYLKKEGEKTGRRGMNSVCSALRSLFRFLQIEGYGLAHRLDKLPRPRIYTHEALPRFLKADQVQRVLNSVERTTKEGIRDYAILILLVTYGMRAAEVARLSLDDLDWIGAKIYLRNRKTRRSDVFPLTVPVGEAIIEYLRNVRPNTGLRQLFLSIKAPICPIRVGSRVSAIVKKYLVASGIPLPDRPGAHLFRHSLAYQLLDSGVSYKVIGDFLGHFSASSTSVYLKIDVSGLGQVALNDGEDVL